MNLEQVRAFKTSDGTIHTDKIKALSHQVVIDLRGAIQTADNRPVIGNITTTDAARIILNNFDKIRDIVNKHNNAMARIKQAVSA